LLGHGQLLALHGDGEQTCFEIMSSHERVGNHKLVGYIAHNTAWKPWLAFNFGYAFGESMANCTLGVAYGACKSTNTFEDFFPTNHIHMRYMDAQAWKNMLSRSANLQTRTTKDGHIEFWYTNLNLASAHDSWYRGG
jgi:hypothetical protein